MGAVGRPAGRPHVHPCCGAAVPGGRRGPRGARQRLRLHAAPPPPPPAAAHFPWSVAVVTPIPGFAPRGDSTHIGGSLGRPSGTVRGCRCRRWVGALCDLVLSIDLRQHMPRAVPSGDVTADGGAVRGCHCRRWVGALCDLVLSIDLRQRMSRAVPSGDVTACGGLMHCVISLCRLPFADTCRERCREEMPLQAVG